MRPSATWGSVVAYLSVTEDLLRHALGHKAYASIIKVSFHTPEKLYKVPTKFHTRVVDFKVI